MSEYMVFDKRAFHLMEPKLRTDKYLVPETWSEVLNEYGGLFPDNVYRREKSLCTPEQIAFIEALDAGKDLGKEGDEKCPMTAVSSRVCNAAADENATPAAAISVEEIQFGFEKEWVTLEAQIFNQGSRFNNRWDLAQFAARSAFEAGVDFAVSKIKGEK